ncbi:hypothetical protein [uncultured Sphingomonas sp.]|uniref:hypothetical protein n=1 Tax=uncultured Sphingomonas sp. TaxID=158754 RepID=UPI0025D192E3|nr:hypothetical protein [uncultured Sphingomonas sp.]
MPIAMLTTVGLAIFVWGGVLIWSLWRAAWLRGAVVGIVLIVTLLVGSAQVAGPEPVAYGITFALSLFLGAGMVVMGVIAHAIRALARVDRA